MLVLTAIAAWSVTWAINPSDAWVDASLAYFAAFAAAVALAHLAGRDGTRAPPRRLRRRSAPAPRSEPPRSPLPRPAAIRATRRSRRPAPRRRRARNDAGATKVARPRRSSPGRRRRRRPPLQFPHVPRPRERLRRRKRMPPAHRPGRLLHGQLALDVDERRAGNVALEIQPAPELRLPQLPPAVDELKPHAPRRLPLWPGEAGLRGKANAAGGRILRSRALAVRLCVLSRARSVGSLASGARGSVRKRN